MPYKETRRAVDRDALETDAPPLRLARVTEHEIRGALRTQLSPAIVVINGWHRLNVAARTASGGKRARQSRGIGRPEIAHHRPGS